MSLQSGQQLGAYEITALLGKGGMGEVYRARDTKLKRDVAVKVLPEEFSRDGDRVIRFQREAEVLASLNHPNIAAIYDVAEADQTRYLVLELVEGETLSDRIRRSPIRPEEALEIATRICEALEAAHEKGIVHRDLKPANVKITPDGKVKVLDFGLAKAMENASPAASVSNSPTLSVAATQAGMILGTAAYMSPEQAKGFQADTRSDLFSFGAVFYEMLTRRQAFGGDTAAEMLASVLIRDVDYTLLPPNLNPRIEELLRRALEKHPKRRWQAAGDVRAELETIASAPHATSVSLPAVPPPRSLWRRAIPIVLTALASGTVAGVAAWTLKPSAPSTVTRFSVPLGEGQEFTRTRSQVAAISPDGQNLVYVGNRQLYLRRLDDMELRAIPGTLQDVGSPFFSPDGRWVGFFSFQDNAIKKIAITGGAPITLCSACSTTLGRGMSWENGTIVFAHGSGQSILGIPESGGKPELWVKAEANELLSSPQLLPGGNALIFAVSKASTGDATENSDIVVFLRSTNQRQVVIHGGTGGRYVSTGHIVYRLGSNLYAVPFDIQHLKTRGEPIPIIQNITSSSQADYGPANFDFSRNGTLVYVPGSSTLIGESRREVLIADRSGKVGTVPGLPPGSYTNPRVSPDGNQVALETVDDGSISIYELSGKSQLRRLTLDSMNSQPVWSPDGKRIAYRSNREAKVGIFVQNADGSGTAERLTTATGSVQEIPFAWHPDGWLAFTRDQRLWTIAVEGDKKISPLTESSISQYNASFSPDGHWVAYTSYEQRQIGPRVFVQQFPNGPRYQATREPSDAPVWSRDGKELFYSSDVGKLVSIRVQTQPSFSVGEPVTLPVELTQQRAIRIYDVLPGGRFLVLRPAPLPGGSGEHPIQQILVVLNWFRELQERVPVK